MTENSKKEKTYKPHIKVYFKSEAEEKAFREFADKNGFSASTWLRSLGIKDMRKGEK